MFEPSGSTGFSVFLWEGRCEDRVASSGVRHFSAIRSVSWICALVVMTKRRKQAQFDSDYSGGDGAPPPFFFAGQCVPFVDGCGRDTAD